MAWGTRADSDFLTVDANFEAFARALLDKFSAPNSSPARGSAIPSDKHSYFTDGRKDFASVLDLH